MITAETLTNDYSAMTSEQMIVATLRLFCGGGVTEIRCLDAGGQKKKTDSGYFDDFAKAARFLRQYVQDKKTKGVYFVVNEVPAELQARAANRFEDWAKVTTADNAITSRRWLYVDLDPIRPSGISSTDKQVQQAMERAADVSEWMRSQGLCEPILAMSGNGAHLHFPIRLPNDSDSLAIVSGVLRTLKEKFSDDVAGVDTTVSNAARICRLYGTTARKGDITADRPHRMARILSVPDYLRLKTGDVCDVDALRAVAAMSEPLSNAVSRSKTSAVAFVASEPRLIPEQYLQDHGFAFKIQAKGEFTNYVLGNCLFNPDHTSPDAYLTQGSRGGIAYKCSHNSCSDYDWQAVKRKYPPKPEHWDRPYQAPVRATSDHATPFLEGGRVKAGDRENIGTVEYDDGGPNVSVKFVARDGATATKLLPRSQLQSVYGSGGTTPVVQLNLAPFSAWDLIHKDTPLDFEIIEGILRAGEVANIIASTKVGKSWFALGLAIAVATGSRWLGRKTRKGNVLLIDNELRPATLRHRIATVMLAMGIEPSQDHAKLEVVSLRGQFSDIQSLEQALKKYSRDEFALLILDAKYRAFGELDENSNTDQTLFHNAVDKIAGDLNSGFVMVHHSTKGDQGGRSVTDVGSGGGSQSRAVDTHLIIRPHSDEGYAVLDAAVRSFAPVEPQTLQWEFPLWRLAQTVEPILKADKSRGDNRQEQKDQKALGQLTDILHTSKEPMNRYELLKQFGGGKDRVNRLIREGLNAGRIVKVGTRKARNGEQADTFMVASRVEVPANSDAELNGLF